MLTNYKKRILIIAIVLLIALLSSSLLFPAENKTYFPDNDLMLVNMPYKYGVKTAEANALNYGLSVIALINEYKDWRSHYVYGGVQYNPPGPAPPIDCLRVMRDSKSDFDVVSEGQAYGMLLALYFDDQDTFNKLYYYVQKHSDPDTGLMHWKINKNDKKVSEFRIEIPHGIPYLYIFDQKSAEEEKNYKVFTPEEEAQLIEIEEGVVKLGRAIFLQSAEQDRQLCSATDADLDIAGALIFAWYKWGNNFYRDEAAKMIRNIMDYDVDDEDLIKPGDKWQNGTEAFNPCYFTPAWLNVYMQFLYDNYHNSRGWGMGYPDRAGVETILDEGLNADYANPAKDATVNYYWKIYYVKKEMYKAMLYINNRNNNTGLFPDWCELYAGIDLQKSTASDRMYWADKDPDTNEWITYPSAIYNGSSKYYQKLSFNNFYDAVRVPWRLANDYVWNGNSDAFEINYYQALFLEENPHIFDGYSIDGSPWKWEDRDGFNFAKGGVWPFTPTFVGMNSCATMISENFDDLLTKEYDMLWDKKEPYGTGYHYYGNTLRLLSLLFMHGTFINYSDLEQGVLRD